MQNVASPVGRRPNVILTEKETGKRVPCTGEALGFDHDSDAITFAEMFVKSAQMKPYSLAEVLGAFHPDPVWSSGPVANPETGPTVGDCLYSNPSNVALAGRFDSRQN